MTIQNLFVADLSDILRIQLECGCGAQASFVLDASEAVPYRCPQCGKDWKVPHNPSLETQIIEKFIEALNQARSAQNGAKDLKIRLVFNAVGASS